MQILCATRVRGLRAGALGGALGRDVGVRGFHGFQEIRYSTSWVEREELERTQAVYIDHSAHLIHFVDSLSKWGGGTVNVLY